VTNLTDYGFFAEIESGVEGLVHVSEIDWTNKNIHPSKVVELGNSLEVMILEVDEEKRRISLGVKQLTENPWQVFMHKYKEGDKIKGNIKSITDFGVFIGLEGDIDGLVHLSDVSWGNEEEAIRQLEKNQEIEAIVLSIDVERERISLGIKQLQEDAFNEFTTSNKKSSRVTGKISEITEERIILDLTEEVQGYVPQKDFKNSSKEGDPEIGDEIEVVVASINKKEREIILSLRALEKAEEREALRDNTEKNKEIEESSSSNIGDMIKAEIEEKEDE
jgi:small subunit ribosomal protein S1